jgi:hypothetical protein
LLEASVALKSHVAFSHSIFFIVIFISHSFFSNVKF